MLGVLQHVDAAQLQRALRVNVLQYAQQQCAPMEWQSQALATSDAYKQQAVDAGLPHESVEVEFVDSSGNPTTETPDYTRSTIDDLYNRGILTEESGGTPVVDFDSVTCTPLSGGYESKFD